MSDKPLSAAERHHVNLLIAEAEHDISLEKRCEMLATVNEEYQRRISMLEDLLEYSARRGEGARRALICAAAYGAAATLAFAWLYGMGK